MPFLRLFGPVLLRLLLLDLLIAFVHISSLHIQQRLFFLLHFFPNGQLSHSLPPLLLLKRSPFRLDVRPLFCALPQILIHRAQPLDVGIVGTGGDPEPMLFSGDVQVVVSIVVLADRAMRVL